MINMIVAVSKNGVIGKDGKLPWHNPEDLKRFKQLTMGGILFVGRNTAKELPSLPGRDVMVLFRNGNYAAEPTLDDVVEISNHHNKIGWIAGGGQIYKAALAKEICSKIYLTLIDQEVIGDTYFPLEILDNKIWLMTHEEVLSEKPLTKLQIWEHAKFGGKHDSNI